MTTAAHTAPAVSVTFVAEATGGGLDIRTMATAPRYGKRVEIDGIAYAVVSVHHRSARTSRAVVRPV